ncbi:MaoC family dehydratase N-terminal domain-containing protein [Chloroflexota bacterium]
MANKNSQKIDCQQIEAGYEFKPLSYQLDASMVADYLRAVGETSSLYQTSDLVPPTAVAAYALAALFGSISLPPGTIHVSQELDFTGTVNAGDTITCQAKVLRKQNRGGLNLMTIGLNVFNRNQEKVIAGKTSLLLPG